MEARSNGNPSTYLGESDILAFLPKALTADIEAIFSDETGFVSTDAANVIISMLAIGISVHYGSRASGVWDGRQGFRRMMRLYHARAPLPYVRGREYQTES